MRDADMNVVRELGCDKEWEAKDPEHVAFLCRETVQVGGGRGGYLLESLIHEGARNGGQKPRSCRLPVQRLCWLVVIDGAGC